MLVHLQHQRAGIPVAQVGDTRAVAESTQRGGLGVGVDVLAQRLRHRVVDGLDRPVAGDVDRLQGSLAIGAGPHHHLRAVGGHRRVLNEFAAAVDPHQVIGMRLISLQQGELRVVGEVHTFIAKRPAEFEDALHSAHTQPFEIELRSDAQVQVEVIGVDVGPERSGVGAAVDLLQDRCLNLKKTLAEQRLPNRAQDVAPGLNKAPGYRVGGQIDVACPHPGLRIGQALPLLRQRSQALSQQTPPVHQHRVGAVAAVPHRTGHLDQVAEIDISEILRRTVHLGTVEEQLHIAGPVPQLCERHSAVVADPQHPTCHRDGDAVVGRQCLGDRVGRRPAHRIGVDALVAQRFQLCHPNPHLFGESVFLSSRRVGEREGGRGPVGVQRTGRR